MTQNLSPATQALAYRIWAHCQPIGWNCTIAEIADALGVDWRRVQSTMVLKGWSGRVRRGVNRRVADFTHSIAKFDRTDLLLGKSEFDTAQFMEAEE